MSPDAHTIAQSMTTPSALSTCAHCGAIVPASQFNHSEDHQFCCAGCRAVYDVIRGSGLGRYYAIKSDAEGDRAPATITHRGFSEFDHSAFRHLYVRQLEGDLVTVELFLPSVHCAACVWLIERLPVICEGVISARLDMRRSLVRIVWKESRVSLSAIGRALDSLGYAPTPARQARMREARRIEDRRQLVRLGVAGACAGNVMLLAFALYAGMFDAIEGPYQSLFRWVSMGLSLISLAWPGRVFFVGAVSALRTRTLHLDLPIAVGLGAGAAWGVVNTIQGSGEIYFDSLSVLVFALLLGRFFQTRQQRSTLEALELLYALTPATARLLPDASADQSQEVPIEAVRPGMVVEALAGDCIPVDGVVIRGSSRIDQSMLTGESRPVEVREGMGVAAGAINLSSVLRVRVDATGEDTRVGRLMKLVEEASAQRAPIVRAADRLAGWFVAAALLLAAGTFGTWMIIDASQAVDHAIALLIVTCPCALGLATPLAVTVAVGRAARGGMLVKGGDVFQSLARTGVAFVDKTGTLTEGRLSIVEWKGDPSARSMAATVEAHSNHPIARAFEAERRDVQDHHGKATNVTQHVGRGVEGDVGEHRIALGSPTFVRGRACGARPDIDRALIDFVQRGLTPIMISIDGHIVAIAGLGDRVREDARFAIDQLHRLGWEVHILSGDDPDVVATVGRRLGLSSHECHGGMSPEAKCDVIRKALTAQTGPVMMVGDGVNDAAALVTATVGIAVHGGAEASLGAADVYLQHPGLTPIVSLIEASRRTMRVIRRNLLASLFYNGLAAALAMTGVINPLIAAVLMPVSSLTVVMISLRSKSFVDSPRHAPIPRGDPR